MTERTSTVDFRHLLDDLADDYPFSPHEALLIEMIANALDAKASHISIRSDSRSRLFEVQDDGAGMSLQDFINYHNFAVSRKRKGVGIGFAGLGAKLGVKLSNVVITETRTGTYQGASKWFFRGDKLLWSEIDQRTLSSNGTKVTYEVEAGSSLLEPSEVVRLIQAHYTPLLDPQFSSIYRRPAIYPKGVSFSVNGVPVGGKPLVSPVRVRNRHEFSITRGHKGEPIGLGYLVLSQDPVPEELHGVAICTYGKVIRRDLFRKFPKDAENITGLVEVPSLVAYLQTNKADFRRDASGRFAQFYREMQRILGEWLTKLGELEERAEPTKESEQLEKVIRSILTELPEFASFFGAPARQKVIVVSPDGTPASIGEGGQLTRGDQVAGDGRNAGTPASPGPLEGEGLSPREEGDQRAAPKPRPVKAGPKVRFESRGPLRLGWVDGDTVVINTGHPAFAKAEAGRLKFYHNLLSIVFGLLDERQGDPETDHLEIVDRFFATWGKL